MTPQRRGFPKRHEYGVRNLARLARKQTGTQPKANRPSLTAHPLFPAIIALWFGALFGLGSLAIRPGLIESLVLKLHIDLIVPAAAPPLGITARLLLSLGMALVGGAIGALIARRITRPKPEVRERRRGAAQVAEGSADPRSFAHGADAQAASRRRPLAIAEDHGPVYDRELAPLPGGAPQILDVTEFDFPARDAEAALPPRNLAADPAALDLSGFLSADEAFEPAAHGSEETPIVSQTGTAMMEDFRSFAGQRPVAAEPAGRAEPQSFAPPSFAPPSFEPQSFAPQSFAPPPFQVPEAAVVPEFQPQAFQPAAPEPEARPFAAPAPFAQPLTEDAATLHPGLAQPAFAPSAFAPPRADAPVFPEPADAQPETALPMPALAATHEDVAPVSIGEATIRDAVERIVSKDLSELSQLQLIERLAQSLQRRRSAAAQAEAPVRTEPAPATGVAHALAARDQDAAVAAPLAPAPEPAAFAPPAEEPRAPHALACEPVAPALMAMPAALRPLGFDDAMEEEDFSAQIPQRMIAMPAAAPAATPVPVPAPQAFAPPLSFAAPQPFAPETEPHCVADAEQDEGVLEDGYSSLLDLSRPAHQKSGFVRIEEPEDAAPAVEPVVIFPGHGHHGPAASAIAQPAPSAPVAAVAAPSEGMPPMRRFDAPASAATPAQPASVAPLPPRDPAETERALRTALSTLQRMRATG